MNETIETEIKGLGEQPVKQLRLRYREVFGEETESTSHAHLLRRIAWRLQAAAEGDLTDRARQRAAELMADPELRLNSRRKPWQQVAVQAATLQRDQRLPGVGMTVEREFQGRLISATVLDAGFAYAGKKFDSLSAIAREVSGTRWNGFAFFRLNQETKKVPNHD